MTAPLALNSELLSSWAEEPRGPVALVRRQKLVPVEGEDGVVFPPTYADIGYSLDTLSDGTQVVTIDSVGSQANRIEPLFKRAASGRPDNPLAALVPQIDIAIGNDRTVSILDAGHRLGDALIRSSDLADEARAAFKLYQDNGDASALAKLAPTSLVFGAWDSRDTQAKLPRIVQSTIRAWGVDVLHRAAQYIPPIDYVAAGALEETGDKSENDVRSQLGFRHAPAVWRDDGRKEKVLGGVVVRGEIRRDVTINLIALRQLGGDNGAALRRYVLSLALVAAAEPPEAFLRQGCLLTPAADGASDWAIVARSGERTPIALDADHALKIAREAAKAFGIGPDRSVTFEPGRARDALDEKKDGKTKKKAKG
jgi:CRISPR-associated protein Csb1